MAMTSLHNEATPFFNMSYKICSLFSTIAAVTKEIMQSNDKDNSSYRASVSRKFLKDKIVPC